MLPPLTLIRLSVTGVIMSFLMATLRTCVLGRSCTRYALPASLGMNNSLESTVPSKALVVGVLLLQHQKQLNTLLDLAAILVP